MSKTTVTVERVYEHPGDEDALRLFVDRLWPRGLRKDAFHYDDWAKDLAPSPSLRQWYSHDTSVFAEFERKYVTELASEDGRHAVDRVMKLADGRPLALLTAIKDVDHSHVKVLADFLRQCP